MLGGDALTPYLAEVVATVRDLVDDRLIGIYLVGSAALGDFDLARSDVDVQAVGTERLGVDERARLAAALAHEALPCPARGLEFVLYASEDLRDPAGPAFSLNLNTGARMGRHVALEPGEAPRFWFTLDVAIARANAVALVGPAPAEVFPELPRGLVLEAADASLAWHASDGADPVATVLGACRTLSWLGDGIWRSKGDSARRVRDRLPDPAVADRALALRSGRSADAVTSDEAAAVLDAARARLRVAAGG